MAKRKQTWNGDDVILLLQEATLEALEAAAFNIEGQAKKNIVKNDQIDTGFMLNSVYTVTPDNSGYSQAEALANAQNPDGVMLPEENLPDVSGQLAAIVAVGAEYGIMQELRNSFLFKAFEAEAQTLGTELKKKSEVKGF